MLKTQYNCKVKYWTESIYRLFVSSQNWELPQLVEASRLIAGFVFLHKIHRWLRN